LTTLGTQYSISGFISRVGDGVGRSDNDRQFVFCNGRPVDLSKFTRVLNEVRDRSDEHKEFNFSCQFF
jgi:DNA mismatch repair ATPase MutL